MHKKILCTILIVILIFFSGCGASKDSNPGNSGIKTSSQAPENVNIAEDKSLAQDQALNQVEDRKIIKNYELHASADDLRKLSDDVEQKAKSMGGYVQNENANEYNISTTVKIPQTKAEEFVAYIEKNYDIKNKSINTNDITQAYSDNDARLKSLKAQESQMMEILKKANTVEDILKVQGELTKIRGDIESLEAAKKLWDNQIDYSTVTINADKNQLVQDNKIGIISSSKFFSAIARGFVNSSTYLIVAVEKIIIFIVANIIWLIILALILWFLYKKYFKNKKA